MRIIERNKKVHSKLAIYGLIGIVITIKSAINNFNSEIEWRNWVSIGLIFLCIFIVLITIHSIIEALKPKIALEINSSGINDKVSFTEAGFIEWKQIKQVFIAKIKGNDHIIIELNDIYEPKINSSFLKQTLVKETREKYGNAIAINKDYVNESLEDILKILKDGIENKKEKTEHNK